MDQVIVELVGAERYEGPEGYWVNGLYQLIDRALAGALLEKKNEAGNCLFRIVKPEDRGRQ